MATIKKNIHEKGKTSDIIIKIEDNHKIVLEMNQKYLNEFSSSTPLNSLQ